MHTVTIDWPNPDCSQNSNKHWRKMYTARKKQKADVALLCRHLPKCERKGFIPVAVTFYPPTEGRRDADNMLSCVKAAIDAIAKQIGVDDSRFWPMSQHLGEIRKPPEVNITLEY